MRIFLGTLLLSIWGCLAAVHTAYANDIVLGIGTTEFSSDQARDQALFELEFHSDPFHRIGGAEIAYTVGAATHSNGDIYIGAGVSLLKQFSDKWFVEASFAPGLFVNAENESDLGSALEFKSLIGFGREVGKDTRLSIAVSHKSNANTGRINPGVNTLSLRLRRSF